jgi:hypothetical protein
MLATCPINLILSDLIAPTLLGEKYKIWRYLLCAVRLLIKLSETVISQLSAGIARLTAKRYIAFPMPVKYRFIKTMKSTNPFYSSSYR